MWTVKSVKILEAKIASLVELTGYSIWEMYQVIAQAVMRSFQILQFSYNLRHSKPSLIQEDIKQLFYFKLLFQI